jgi:lipopolysaccharide export system permease protein
MLQNKIYHNFVIEILKTFLVILFGLSIIALTVRAVNFLDLIVDSGYPLDAYFKYSFLNMVGIAPKFIPFSFLIALSIFIIKHLQDSEFLILWTSGVKKIFLVNLFLLTSIIVLILYLIFSTFLTPYTLNQSRQLLSQDKMNSILPTLKTQEFNDTFKDLIFFIEKKSNNEVQNIFLQDKGNHFKSLSSNNNSSNATNIIAKSGIIQKKKLILINGQIISSKKNNLDNEIIKFDQLNIDLSDAITGTIKSPKLQETSTIDLINCLLKKNFINTNCNAKNEIIASLNRRIVLPFYIPVIALISSLLLIKSSKKYLNKNIIFFYSFILLIIVELTVRYTGINYLSRLLFLISPFVIFLLLYSILVYKLNVETKS